MNVYRWRKSQTVLSLIHTGKKRSLLSNCSGDELKTKSLCEKEGKNERKKNEEE